MPEQDAKPKITAFKHPQVYADLNALYMMYWQQHQRMPKPFRFTTGEFILQHITLCLQFVIEANLIDKTVKHEREQAIILLRDVRSKLVVLRGFFATAWQLKFITNKSLARIQIKLSEIEKQVTKWQQWHKNFS